MHCFVAYSAKTIAMALWEASLVVEVWAASQSMLAQGFESFDLHLLGAVVQEQRVWIWGPKTYGRAGPTAGEIRAVGKLIRAGKCRQGHSAIPEAACVIKKC